MSLSGLHASIPAMKITREKLFERLAKLDIETQTVEHAAAFTVEQAKAHRGDITGAHAKNLFLKDKKGVFWLVVCLEDRQIDMKELKSKIGSAHLSFGKPEALMEMLGVEPGSVSPFTLLNDTTRQVRVVLDQEMMDGSALNFHPLENTATTQISPEGLLLFITSTGHQPDIIAL